MIKNNKGFTLVELIGVIVIIAIIMILLISSATNIINRTRAGAQENLMVRIRAAAENYALDTNNTVFFIHELVINGYIDAEDDDGIYTPTDFERINCYIVEVNLVAGSYVAEIGNQAFPKGDGCDESKLPPKLIEYVSRSGEHVTLKINCPEKHSSATVMITSNRGMHPMNVSCDSNPTVVFRTPPTIYTATIKDFTNDFIISDSVIIN